MSRFSLASLFLCLTTLVACSDPSGPPSDRVATIEATVLQAQQTSSFWAGDTVDVQFRALDADGKGVPGVALHLAVNGGGFLTAASAVTDRMGLASARWILGVREDTVVATVEGRDVSVALPSYGMGMTAYLDEDDLQLVGPSCLNSEAAEIMVGDSAHYPDSQNWSLAVEDTTIAVIKHIPVTSGTRSIYGGQVWGRSPGTTRLILTQHHLADTTEVQVSPRSGPALALVSGTPDWELRTLVPGDTLTLAEGTSDQCRADALPMDYRIDLESLDPQVVRVDSTRSDLVHGASIYTPFTHQTVGYFRAVGTGVARVVASAPFSTPDTVSIRVTASRPG